MHRCYCEQPISMDSTVCLQGREAHHLLHVLRAKQGMLVTLFDGSGAEFLAEVGFCVAVFFAAIVIPLLISDFLSARQSSRPPRTGQQLPRLRTDIQRSSGRFAQFPQVNR